MTLIFLAAFTAFACAAGTASGAGSQPVAVSGAMPISGCASGDLAGIANASVEPRLAVSRRLDSSGARVSVGVWMQGVGRAIVAARSADSGSHWTTSALPFTACVPGGLNYQQAADPWVSIGPDNTTYVTALAVTYAQTVSGPIPVANAIVATRSTDLGKSWSRPTVIQSVSGVAGLTATLDKPTVVADPTHHGVAYAVWHRDPGTGAFPEGLLTETTDRGLHWSKPRVIVPRDKWGGGSFYHVLVADTRRDILYDVFDMVRQQLISAKKCHRDKAGKKICHTKRTPANNGKFDGYIAFVESRDGAKTWSKPRVIADNLSLGFISTRAGAITPGPGFDATVDAHSGTVYVVWTDARFTNLSYDQILMSRSSNAGKHWTAPLRVGGQAASFDPTIAITSGGELGVTYYDLRELTPESATVPADYWLATSTDKGMSFSETRLAGPADLRLAPEVQGYFVGDYQGLAPLGDEFEAFFALPDAPPGPSSRIFAVLAGSTTARFVTSPKPIREISV